MRCDRPGVPPLAAGAFKSIEDIRRVNANGLDCANATRVDTHGQNSYLLKYTSRSHASWLTMKQCMPSQTFYYALVPDTGGRPTPSWGVATCLQFMANNSISYAVLSISTPGSNVFLGGGAGVGCWAKEVVERMVGRGE
jgi:hypothetical protein